MFPQKKKKVSTLLTEYIKFLFFFSLFFSQKTRFNIIKKLFPRIYNKRNIFYNLQYNFKKRKKKKHFTVLREFYFYLK